MEEGNRTRARDSWPDRSRRRQSRRVLQRDAAEGGPGGSVARARGTAVFLNSHLLSEVEQICDRLAVVDHGRVIATGTMAQILGQDGAVRVRVTGLPADGRAELGSFGNLEDEGEWLTFRGLTSDRV